MTIVRCPLENCWYNHYGMCTSGLIGLEQRDEGGLNCLCYKAEVNA